MSAEPNLASGPLDLEDHDHLHHRNHLRHSVTHVIGRWCKLTINWLQLLINVLHPPALLVISIHVNKNLQTNSCIKSERERESEGCKYSSSNCLCRVVLEYRMKPSPAVLVEKECTDNQRNGEGWHNCWFLQSKDTHGYYLCQHQREDCRVMHSGPKLPPSLISCDIYVENL